VLTAFCVQTLILQAQAFHGLSTNDMGFDNLIDICLGDVPIPHGIRIHHDVWPVLALIEAARLIGAHSPLESAGGKLLFEKLLQTGFRQRIAASARMPRRALVSTNENVSFEFRHQTSAVLA